MTRRPTSPAEMMTATALSVALDFSEDAPSCDDKVAYLQRARTLAPGESPQLDSALLTEIEKRTDGLRQAAAGLAEAQKILDRYGSAPLFPATFLHLHEDSEAGAMAVVAGSAGRRVVALGEHLPADSIRSGDELYLSADQTVAMAVQPYRASGGELAEFECLLPDGRMQIRGRGDELMVVDVADTLAGAEHKRGDLIRWDRIARMALERVERAAADSPFVLKEPLAVPLSAIGGQGRNVSRLVEALTARFIDPATARLFKIDTSGMILLKGAPGTGKTLSAQAAAYCLEQKSGRPVRMAVVKGSSWNEPWVGATERNIGNVFSTLRDAAADGFCALLFIDEADAVGRVRGQSVVSFHHDTFASKLLAELDGYTRLENVAVICATNRADTLDPAFLDRVNLELEYRRPNAAGAREILGIHLDADIPYCPNGVSAADTRAALVDLAIGSLYTSEGTEVATLKFRDGRVRTVLAQELVSGRLLNRLAGSARDRAYGRAIRQKAGVGVRMDDVQEAVADSIERLRGLLTVNNAHHHLLDLAADEIVMNVEPVRPRVRRPHRYFSLAA